MRFKYKRLEKFLKKCGFVKEDSFGYSEAILMMTYKFKKCQSNMINENYKIRILFTKNNNFNIVLEIINHPSIGYSENEYGEGLISVVYESDVMQLYAGICPGYFKTKSIIYYTCNDYINENKTLLDYNLEFEKVTKNSTLPFMLDRMTMTEFEDFIREFINSDNISRETCYVETSSILQ